MRSYQVGFCSQFVITALQVADGDQAKKIMRSSQDFLGFCFQFVTTDLQMVNGDQAKKRMLRKE